MRRIVRTLLVTFALFALTSGSFGFASAAMDGNAGGIDLPRPGDRATYSVQEFHVKDGLQASTPPRIEIEWLPEMWLMDAQFQMRLVHPVKMIGHFGITGETESYERVGYVDAATGEGIATSAWGDANPQRNDGGVLGTGLATQEPAAAFHADFYGGPKGVCAMRTALHGATEPPATMRIDGHCDYIGGAQNLTYAYQGVAKRAGQQWLHYQDEGNPLFEAYYQSGSPFPVQFTTTLANLVDPDWLDGRMYRLTLESEQRGNGAYTPLFEPLMAPSPGPVRTVPHPHFQFDSSGLDSLISFNDAWQAILDDTAEPRMVDFLAAHPRAYLAEAGYTETQEGDGTRHGYWFAAAADGEAHHQKRVVIEPIANIPGVANAGYQVRVIDADDDYFTYPPPELVPDRLLLVADQADRFRFFVGEELVNSMSYWVDCNDPCTEAATTLWMGHVEQSYRGAAQSLDGSHYRFQVIGFALDGTAKQVHGYEQIRPSEVPLPADGSGPLAPSDRSGNTRAVWAAPSPAAVTGFGILALVGGAIYHYWPAIRALPILAGFSRIRKETLLEHPGRADIMALVEARPGIHFQELHRQLAMARGTLTHHVLKLEQGGLIRSRAASGRTCYFAPHVGRQEADLAAVLQSTGTRQVYEVLQANPEALTKEVADAVGMAPSTVSYHRAKLRKAGFAA